MKELVLLALHAASSALNSPPSIVM